MEDVGFTDDMNDQDGESVGMAEKDDADLSFQKHTGDYYSYNVKQILSATISCHQENIRAAIMSLHHQKLLLLLLFFLPKEF